MLMIEVSHLQKCRQKLSPKGYKFKCTADGRPRTLPQSANVPQATSPLKGNVKAERALQGKLQEVAISWCFLMTDPKRGRELAS